MKIGILAVQGAFVEHETVLKELGAPVLSVVDGHVVAVQYHKQLALAFHPELDSDLYIHQHRLSDCIGHAGFRFILQEPLREPCNQIYGAKDAPFMRICFAASHKLYYSLFSFIS